MSLAVVLDADPSAWKSSGVEDFAFTLQQILVFMNSHLTLSPSNTVSMVLATPPIKGSLKSGSQLVFPRESQLFEDSSADTGKLGKLQKMNDMVLSSVSRTLSKIGPGRTSLAGALSKAFCHLNREKVSLETASESNNVKFSSRILVVTSRNEFSDDYTSIMNCIFCAQNKGIRIDSCVLGDEFPILQQAASLTKGLYSSVPREDVGNLLQYLLSIHLPDDSLKGQLNLPLVRSVNFAASCLNEGCGKKIEPFGFICSECLSMFCSKCRPTMKKPKCVNCGSLVVR